MKNFILTLFTAVVLLNSCIEIENPDGETDITFICRTDSGNTKSLFSGADNQINNWNIFIYDNNGDFVQAEYSSSKTVSLRLRKGQSYHCLVLANTGKVDQKSKLSDMLDMEYTIKSTDSFARYGLPMASKDILFSCNSATESLPVEVTRLVARYDLDIDKSQLKESSFTVESVAICQSSLSVTPFKGGYSSSNVATRDMATSEQVRSLNDRGKVTFYALENCKGCLLGGNTDPAKKIPDNISAQSSTCTYLEISGEWSTTGARSKATCRLYLGRDNCSDFNIDRNTTNNVRVNLTDFGMLGASWQISRSNLTDSRELTFETSDVTVVPGQDYINVKVNESLGGVNYSLAVNELSASVGKLDYHFADRKLYLKSTYSGRGTPNVEFRIKTWDGVIKDTLNVHIDQLSTIENIPEVLLMGRNKSRVFYPVFGPTPAELSKVEIQSTNQNVVRTIWHWDSSGCELTLVASGTGLAYVNLYYGNCMKSIIVYVPGEYKFTGNPKYLAMKVGDKEDFSIYADPDGSMVEDLEITSSNPAAVSVTNVHQVPMRDFVYHNINFGTVHKGAIFKLNALQAGLSTIKLQSTYPTYSEDLNIYVLGEQTYLLLSYGPSSGTQTTRRFISNGNISLSKGTDCSLSFNAPAFITSIQVLDYTVTREHTGWKEDNYYSLTLDGVRYRESDMILDMNAIHNSAMTINGTDCSLILRITFGSCSKVVDISLNFA